MSDGLERSSEGTAMWRGRGEETPKGGLMRKEMREHIDLPASARFTTRTAAATGSARAVSLHIDSRLVLAFVGLRFAYLDIRVRKLIVI